jgi:hypothetical protein
MPPSYSEVRSAIAFELGKFRFPAAHDALKARLIEPFRQDRVWEHSERASPVECWLVARMEHDVGIAYATDGFGPSRPWGVVYTDVTDHCGPDFCWHANLEDAFIATGQWDGPLPEGYDWA